MPNSYIEEMNRVKFPRDNNTSPVAVQYVFNPTDLNVYPVSGVALPDGTTALNTNLVGGLMQVENLQVTSSPYTAKDTKQVAATLDVYHSSTSGQFDTHLVLHKTVVVKNTGAAAADVRIYGSADGTEFDIVLVPTVSVPAGQTLVHYSNEYFYGLRIDTRSTVAGSPTAVAIKIAGISN